MSKYFVITHHFENNHYLPINYKNYTEECVEAIEVAREYQAKYPDGVVEVVEEGGSNFRMIVTSREITVIGSYPHFYFAQYPIDTPTQNILDIMADYRS